MHLPSHPHRPCIQSYLLERHPQHLPSHHHPCDSCGCSFRCEFTKARSCIEPLDVLCHCLCVCCGRDPSGSLERRARATLRSCCCSFAMHVHAWKRRFVAAVRLPIRLDDGTAGRRSHLAAVSHTITWCAAMSLLQSHHPSATAAARTNVHVSSLLVRFPSSFLPIVVRACAPRVHGGTT